MTERWLARPHTNPAPRVLGVGAMGRLRLLLILLSGLSVSAVAALPAQAAPSRALVSHAVPIRYVSQLAEPAPAGWRASATPYCAAAASLTVMESFGVALPAAPLATTFAIGRAGNTTNDPGLDPDGISHLLRTFGGAGRIHAYADRGQALDELIGRLNLNAPVVALTQAGNHAVTVYGYEAIAGGAVTSLFVADPLSGFMGRVAVESWLWAHLWMGTPFSAPGDAWRGRFIFVAYRDARGAAVPALAGPPTWPVVSRDRAYASAWVSQSPVPRLARAAVATVTVSVRNRGTSAWVRGTPSEVRLGIPGDDTIYQQLGLADGWLMGSRPAVQSEPNVAPSEVATFSFRIRGALAGTFLVRLRPVVDGLAWLDDDGIYIVVGVD